MTDKKVNDALQRRARRKGSSKPTLIRRFRSSGNSRPTLHDDPLDQWIGGDAFDPEPVDDVVYR